MQFTTFISDGQPRLGLVDGDSVIDLHAAYPAVPPDLRLALRDGVNLESAAQLALAGGGERLPLVDQRLAPVIPEPGKIVCLGLNYFDHAKEGGREKPDYPWFFLRTTSSLIGHGEPGVVPKVSQRLDYEAELAAVIGQRVPRHVSQSSALEYVFGYTCFNDMSVRDYQKRTSQWTIGKIFDGTGAFGPVLVTADSLPPGAVGLGIECRLNAETMQRANTRDMIWGVAETIALLSEVLTLEPGDVIVMGTPAGVGMARSPAVWMKAGDRVEVHLEGIPVLVNPIVNES